MTFISGFNTLYIKCLCTGHFTYIIIILQNRDSNHTLWMKQQSLGLPMGKLKKKKHDNRVDQTGKSGTLVSIYVCSFEVLTSRYLEQS